MIPTKPIIYAIIAIALGCFTGGYSLTKLICDAKRADIEKNAAIERQNSAVLLSEQILANELLKNKIGAQNERERTIVADFDRRLSSSRVRLPADLCADYGQANATSAGEPATSASGVLSADAGAGLGRTQEALDWYVERQKDRAKMTEGVMLICRPVNEWARKQ